MSKTTNISLNSVFFGVRDATPWSDIANNRLTDISSLNYVFGIKALIFSDFF